MRGRCVHQLLRAQCTAQATLQRGAHLDAVVLPHADAAARRDTKSKGVRRKGSAARVRAGRRLLRFGGREARRRASPAPHLYVVPAQRENSRVSAAAVRLRAPRSQAARAMLRFRCRARTEVDADCDVSRSRCHGVRSVAGGAGDRRCRGPEGTKVENSSSAEGASNAFDTASLLRTAAVYSCTVRACAWLQQHTSHAALGRGLRACKCA